MSNLWPSQNSTCFYSLIHAELNLVICGDNRRRNVDTVHNLDRYNHLQIAQGKTGNRSFVITTELDLLAHTKIFQLISV